MKNKKSYIGIDELIVLAQMKRSFSIGGFDNYTFFDVFYRNNEYYCFYVSKENCPMNFQFNNFIDLKNTLYKTLSDLLYQYFDENKLLEEKNDLIYASNVIKSRQSHGYVVDEAHQNNKVLVDLMKRRKKETGTILKNTLYKTLSDVYFDRNSLHLWNKNIQN